MFADALDSPDGRVAQLYVIARMLRRVDDGDHPCLAAPLIRYAHGLLESSLSEPVRHREQRDDPRHGRIRMMREAHYGRTSYSRGIAL